MQKMCPGYHSDGSAGAAYDQDRHAVENDAAHFSPGKSQCRDCYRAYAADWRAKRGVGGGATSARRTSSRSPRTTVVLPDFRAPALERAAGEDAEMVSEEDLANSHSHAFVPQADLIETWGAVANAAANGSHPFNLLFLGPSGSGKTEAAQYLAALVGLPFTKVDAAAMTDPESWFGTREVVNEDGASVTTYRPSSFVLAIEQPGVLLIDELNRVRDEHRNVLLPLMDGTHQVTNPLTGDVVVKHPRCFIIGTGNRGIQFTGTYAVDPALMTRMLTIEFDYAAHDAEVTIAREASGCEPEVAELFTRFADDVRTRAKNDEDYSPVSTREIIAACKLVAAGLSTDVAAKVAIINTASPEGGAGSVRAGLEMIWQGIRQQAAPAGTVAPVICGADHPWQTDSNGNPLTCAMAVGSGHGAEHVSASGMRWTV